jgi:single-stranded DNA-binding protein
MNCFTLIAVGNLAKDPELMLKGDTTYTRVCLIGNDFVGKDADGHSREASISLWLVAFEGLGEAIARNARKGHQLFVQAQIRANNWTRRDEEKQLDHTYVVQSFRFGARGRSIREVRALRKGPQEADALETL